MKKLLLITFTFFTIAASAQLHVELGLGATQSIYLENNDYINESGKLVFCDKEQLKVFPLLKLSVGYEFKRVVVELVEQPSLTRTVNSPKLFGAKLGYNFSGYNSDGFVPSIGYYINHCNSDNSKYNSQHIGYSLKYQWSVNDNAGLYAEVLIVGKNNQVTAGIHYQF